ncbi:MAG TPA: portal protein [Candidatus Avimonas sp.]|nr:hypothetical protein [Clostridiales bacterium]HPU58346.1 portal protein [Candidatus Avimonas sp.]
MEQNSLESMKIPKQVWEEYTAGIRFKSALGKRGLYEQSKLNERFFIGDQWHGARCGNDRPLVRHNLIKRIGEYKMAMICKNQMSVTFSVDGISSTLSVREKILPLRQELAKGGKKAALDFAELAKSPVPTEQELSLVMDALSNYFSVTAERVKLDDLKEQALRNAYISGTGILYTWWDDRILTGLYADDARTTPIRGDIACEVLDVENVYFGDPNLDSIQEQPYILIAQRRNVEDLRREARKHNRPEYEIQRILPDRDVSYLAGERSEMEPEESAKATVITKFWKEYMPDGSGYTIKAIRTCREAVIRPEWDLGIRLYPFAKFSWERRRGCAYGESEITYLIPNQIAINRMITASVWAVMMMGMPIMVVNSDIVTGDVTNDPGQIIPVAGNGDDMVSAIKYVNPPDFSPAFDQNITSLINNTLRQTGANDVVLGDVKPENTSAILAVRETATLPLTSLQNRFYSFLEDVARIWAEFWVAYYGQRKVKIKDELGTWYLPFDGKRYRDLVINARVDVGASTLWSEEQVINTLNSLYDREIIDAVQYLSRLPKGSVPDLSQLIGEILRKSETKT